MKTRPSAAALLALLLMLLCATARAQMGYVVGTWAASPMELPAANAGNSPHTLREFVHVSISGNQFTAISLSNEFGHEPLTIAATTLAHRAAGSATDTPVPVTFDGKSTITIPPGHRVLSDEMHFKFPAQSDVAVTLYLPAQPMTSVTGHAYANATNYTAEGNQAAAKQLTAPTEISSWPYLAEIDVATATQSSIVCLGDSITDGGRSTRDANLRWPDQLAARLLANPSFGERFGVLNEGISGNRILHDGAGPSAIDRVERDVLDTHGYYADGRRYVIILEGINDIGRAFSLKTPRDSFNRPAGDSRVSAEDLIAGYKYLVGRAHANNLKVIGATLTPYTGAMYASPDGEKVRQALNQWIRTTRDLDGVIDFDKATRDPANPSMFLPAYDSGDHLHPNDAGMKAMASAIDLNLFR
jgi:lysophospholipase L1-like esterase